jgi:hypothetical protein
MPTGSKTLEKRKTTMELLPKDAEKRQSNKKKNKVILGVAGAILALMFVIAAVAGGSDSSTPASGAKSSPVNTTQGTASPQTNSKPSEAVSEKDAQFAALVSPDLPAGVEVRHAKNNADVVCTRLEQGDSPAKVRAGVRELRGTKAGDSIYEAAIAVYCPKAVK